MADDTNPNTNSSGSDGPYGQSSPSQAMQHIIAQNWDSSLGSATGSQDYEYNDGVTRVHRLPMRTRAEFAAYSGDFFNPTYRAALLDYESNFNYYNNRPDRSYLIQSFGLWSEVESTEARVFAEAHAAKAALIASNERKAGQAAENLPQATVFQHELSPEDLFNIAAEALRESTVIDNPAAIASAAAIAGGLAANPDLSLGQTQLLAQLFILGSGMSPEQAQQTLVDIISGKEVKFTVTDDAAPGGTRDFTFIPVSNGGEPKHRLAGDAAANRAAIDRLVIEVGYASTSPTDDEYVKRLATNGRIMSNRLWGAHYRSDTDGYSIDYLDDLSDFEGMFEERLREQIGLDAAAHTIRQMVVAGQLRRTYTSQAEDGEPRTYELNDFLNPRTVENALAQQPPAVRAAYEQALEDLKNSTVIDNDFKIAFQPNFFGYDRSPIKIDGLDYYRGAVPNLNRQKRAVVTQAIISIGEFLTETTSLIMRGDNIIAPPSGIIGDIGSKNKLGNIARAEAAKVTGAFGVATLESAYYDIWLQISEDAQDGSYERSLAERHGFTVLQGALNFGADVNSLGGFKDWSKGWAAAGTTFDTVGTIFFNEHQLNIAHHYSDEALSKHHYNLPPQVANYVLDPWAKGVMSNLGTQFIPVAQSWASEGFLYSSGDLLKGLAKGQAKAIAEQVAASMAASDDRAAAQARMRIIQAPPPNPYGDYPSAPLSSADPALWPDTFEELVASDADKSSYEKARRHWLAKLDAAHASGNIHARLEDVMFGDRDPGTKDVSYSLGRTTNNSYKLATFYLQDSKDILLKLLSLDEGTGALSNDDKIQATTAIQVLKTNLYAITKELSSLATAINANTPVELGAGQQRSDIDVTSGIFATLISSIIDALKVVRTAGLSATGAPDSAAVWMETVDGPATRDGRVAQAVNHLLLSFSEVERALAWGADVVVAQYDGRLANAYNDVPLLNEATGVVSTGSVSGAVWRDETGRFHYTGAGDGTVWVFGEKFSLEALKNVPREAAYEDAWTGTTADWARRVRLDLSEGGFWGDSAGLVDDPNVRLGESYFRVLREIAESATAYDAFLRENRSKSWARETWHQNGFSATRNPDSLLARAQRLGIDVDGLISDVRTAIIRSGSTGVLAQSGLTETLQLSRVREFSEDSEHSDWADWWYRRVHVSEVRRTGAATSEVLGIEAWRREGDTFVKLLFDDEGNLRDVARYNALGQLCDASGALLTSDGSHAEEYYWEDEHRRAGTAQVLLQDELGFYYMDGSTKVRVAGDQVELRRGTYYRHRSTGQLLDRREVHQNGETLVNYRRQVDSGWEDVEPQYVEVVHETDPKKRIVAGATVAQASNADYDQILQLKALEHSATGSAIGDFLSLSENVTAQNSSLYGGGGNDSLTGNSRRNLLDGGAGDDAIDGGDSDDEIIGGAGNDRLEGGRGADILNGGSGTDTVSYQSSPVGIEVSLRTGRGHAGEALNDTLREIENVVGSRFNDIIEGGAQRRAQFDAISYLQHNQALIGEFLIKPYQDAIRGFYQSEYVSGTRVPWFDYDAYLANNPDVAAHDYFKNHAWEHFIKHGMAEQRFRGEIDVGLLIKHMGRYVGDDYKLKAERHWVEQGQAQGLHGAYFDGQAYLAANPDIAADPFYAANPYAHWYTKGANEARSGSGFDAERYEAMFPELASHARSVGAYYRHWLRVGQKTAAGANPFTWDVANSRLEGLAGDDQLTGGAGSDTLDGGTGNDVLRAGIGDDVLLGGDGDDVLDGGQGADRLEGGAGRDAAHFGTASQGVTVYLALATAQQAGSSATDTLASIEDVSGSAYDDHLYGDHLDNRIYGDRGHDQIYGGAGNDTLVGAAGDDVLTGDHGGDWIDGSEGKDTASYYGASSGVVASLAAGKGTGGEAAGDRYTSVENLTGSLLHGDQLLGDDNANVLDGLGGNDAIWAGGGNDIVYAGEGDDEAGGGAGDDTIWGGAGADTLWGELGHDTLGGGDGDDRIGGHDGNDVVWGGSGNDTVWGNRGDDAINGEDGNDLLWGQEGNDRISGGAGHDIIGGNEGLDVIEGGDGFDTLYGDLNDDWLYGGGDDDTLHGGDGRDWLQGGFGADTLVGGAGYDTFAFELTTDGRFTDVIKDFQSGDTIRFKDLEGLYIWTTEKRLVDGKVEVVDVLVKSLNIYQSGNNVVIGTSSNPSKVVIENFTNVSAVEQALTFGS